MALVLLPGYFIGILEVWLYEERRTAGSFEHRALYRPVHASMQP